MLCVRFIPNEKISAILTDNGSNMIAAFKTQFQQNEATEDESEDESNGSAHLQSPASSVKSSDDGEDQGMDMDIDSDALKEIEQFDQLELQHDNAFAVQKRLSCFNTHYSSLYACSTPFSHQSVLYSQRTSWPRNFQNLLEIDFTVWPQGYQRLSYPMEFNILNDLPSTCNTTPHHSSSSGSGLGCHLQQ